MCVCFVIVKVSAKKSGVDKNSAVRVFSQGSPTAVSQAQVYMQFSGVSRMQPLNAASAFGQFLQHTKRKHQRYPGTTSPKCSPVGPNMLNRTLDHKRPFWFEKTKYMSIMINLSIWSQKSASLLCSAQNASANPGSFEAAMADRDLQF